MNMNMNMDMDIDIDIDMSMGNGMNKGLLLIVKGGLLIVRGWLLIVIISLFSSPAFAANFTKPPNPANLASPANPANSINFTNPANLVNTAGTAGTANPANTARTAGTAGTAGTTSSTGNAGTASTINTKDKKAQVLATVNKRPITVEDFLDFHQTRPRMAKWNNVNEQPQSQSQPQPQPQSQSQSQSQPQGQPQPQSQEVSEPEISFQDLIDKMLMVEEAYKLYPKAMDPYAPELANFEQRCLINMVSEKKIDQSIKITEQEVSQKIPEYQKYEVHLRRLVTAKEEEIVRLKKELDQGADFAALAKKYSLGEEAHKGGDFGFMTFDQGLFPKKVVEEIFQLRVGEVGNPSRIREGYALFKVTEKRKANQATLDRAGQYIRQQMLQERKKQKWDQLFEQLKKKSSIVVNEVLFKEIEQAIAQQEGPSALARMAELEIAKIGKKGLRLKDIIPSSSDLASGGTRPWEKDTSILRNVLERQVRIILVADYGRQLGYHTSAEVKKNIIRFKDDLMARHLIAEKVYKDVVVSKDDGQAYYQKHKSEYLAPEQVLLDQIILQDESTALDLWRQIKKGADLSELAKKYPLPEGIIKGFFTKGGSGLGIKFEDKVFSLKKGEISEVIKTHKGYHLVKVKERKEQGYIDLAEVEPNLRETLLSQKKQQALIDYITGLRKKSQITINQPLFQKIVNENYAL